jgi:mono/diheme cytochrome c family protein
MKLSAVVVLFAITLGAEFARAQTAEKRDLGAEVRKVFLAKCVGCHGPDLPQPKGRFGYILDLPRVAKNPEIVIPERPEQSEMWVLVSRGEMPQADSPTGPLTGKEKEIIREWIAAGAPDAVSQQPTASEASTNELAVTPTPRLIRWLGKFHLLLLHFPIALMLAAALGEVLSMYRGSRVPGPAVGFCLSLAAIVIVPTVVLGYFHAASGNGVSSPQLLTAHRVLGTIACGWVVVTAILARLDTKHGARSLRVRVALIVGSGVVAMTAHLGGLMAHGSNFFDW